MFRSTKYPVFGFKHKFSKILPCLYRICVIMVGNCYEININLFYYVKLFMDMAFTTLILSFLMFFLHCIKVKE